MCTLIASAKLKAQMAATPFQPCSQVEALHYSHIHGMLALRRLPISGWSSSKQALCLRHRRQPLMSLKIVPRMDAYTTSSQDTSTCIGPSPKGVATQMPQSTDVVIVGGGIAGLATALALHRLGVNSVLMEQSERLRTAGATITLWTNAWKALEALGIADKLRDKFVTISGMDVIGKDGNLLTSLMFNKGSRNVEMRAVKRKTLLEALREPIPNGVVFYDSRVVGIKKIDGGYTEVQCQNRKTIQTKVLIGCDGIGSTVAKYMNMGEPRYAGESATRGMAIYPDGHKLGSKFTQIIGQGVRAGMIPMDANRVYWFVVFNAPDERLSDVELVREEALNYVKGWPSAIIEAINRSPLESFSRRGISDRWMWPIGGPSLYNEGVTLMGDAMHPMTPTLGQGGCVALEDAVILARNLSKALSTNINSSTIESMNDTSQEIKRIDLALKSYTEERWPRILPMMARSYFIGAFLHLDNGLIFSVRNKVIPKIINVERFLDHTFYDCGTLQH